MVESFHTGSPGIERCVKGTSHSFSGKHDIQSSWLMWLMSSFRMWSISSLDHIKAVALYEWIQMAVFENKSSWSAENSPRLSETTDNTLSIKRLKAQLFVKVTTTQPQRLVNFKFNEIERVLEVLRWMSIDVSARHFLVPSCFSLSRFTADSRAPFPFFLSWVKPPPKQI